MPECFYCYNKAQETKDPPLVRDLVKCEFTGMHICGHCAETLRGNLIYAIEEFRRITLKRCELQAMGKYR